MIKIVLCCKNIRFAIIAKRNFTMDLNKKLMRRAMELAKRGRGNVSPNPLVGAVIVKNGRIVGEGYHKRAGTPHAEIIAIKRAGKNAKNSILYVNLEPCCHYGKTPPCTDAIIKAGIKEVYVGIKDPNPLVNGKGIKILKKNGIKVQYPILQDEVRKLNEFYITYTEKKRPFVILKIAQTIDGKIADRDGKSKWITNELARKKVHSLRNSVDAILTGIGTVAKDNPQFTVRYKKTTKQPLSIVLDTHLKINSKSNIIRQGTIIATSKNTDERKEQLLRKKGVQIWKVKGEDNTISIYEVLKKAYKAEIQSIFIEAGRRVVSSFLKEKLVDKIYIFIGNKILGQGISAFEDLETTKLSDAVIIRNIKFKRFNDNILIEGYVYGNY